MTPAGKCQPDHVSPLQQTHSTATPTGPQTQMDHFPSHWGKPRQDNVDPYSPMPLYSSLTPQVHPWEEPITRTLNPLVTGSSVIALKYKDGIMMAADNLASYGSLARFRDVERLYPVGEHTVVGASGDMSDFHYIKHVLDSLMIKETYIDDGHVLGTPHIYEYLFRVMYNHRSKFNPLWNSLVVGGVHKKEKYAYVPILLNLKHHNSNVKLRLRISCHLRFLGYINLRGTTYKSSTVATGFGAEVAQPLMRKEVEGKEDTLTEEEAIKIINTCMKVLFYMDARSLNKVSCVEKFRNFLSH
ncbi:nucleophile aminohydrolase [Jimgerdemannia flammicorona]|uniref:Nucleophile aminohydrolase n=1 Tax=Jimgerdemannia flammicorona TaxID=994334 RepID=A0A433QTN1_9FUNG|nr:nucleophile aminohydrolase [Jimgerdemannia flammicorona]